MKKGKIIIPSVIMMALCAIIPFVIHFSAPFFPSELSADGVLSYVIEVISAISTFALALVAIWQTINANDMSDKANALSGRMLKIEEDRNRMEIRPFIMVTGWRGIEIQDKTKVFLHPDELYVEVENYGEDKPLVGLELSIQNVTNGYLSAQFNGAKSKQCEWKQSYSNQSKMSVSILPGDTHKIIFVATHDFFNNQEGDIIHFEFILENRFSNRYKEEFDIFITSFTNKCIHQEGEYYCHLFVQNFSIGKFEKKDGETVLISEEL